MFSVNFDDQKDQNCKAGRSEGRSAFVQVPLEILRNENLSSAALKLYLILLTYAHKKTVAWPGQALLAREMHLSVRRIRTLLEELERESLIITRRVQGHNNTYTLAGKKLLKAPITNLQKETSTLEKEITGVEGKETSAEVHEFNYPVCETPSRENEEGEHLSSELVTTQVKKLSSNLPDSKSVKPGGIIGVHNLFESLLTQKLKVSHCHACELADIARRNGRDLSYLERLIAISNEGTIYNPVGFVRFMIMRDAEPDRGKVARPDKPDSTRAGSKASNSNQIDFAKYTTGKYAYLTAPNNKKESGCEGEVLN